MILVADSGSSKADWRIIHPDGSVQGFTSLGLNPFHVDPASFQSILSSSFPNAINPKQIRTIYFYGSGCASDDMARKVKNALIDFFYEADVSVYSDILGAARALFQNKSGLVVILGTGASVAYFSGESISRKTPSLGFSLGDEGSGANLGKTLIRLWQYGELESELESELNSFCPLPLHEILIKVYKEPFAGKFLASFVPFILKNSSHHQISTLISTAFDDLVKMHLIKYDSFKYEPIGIVGSVGFQFKETLRMAIEKYGGKVHSIIQYPIDGIQVYHSDQIK